MIEELMGAYGGRLVIAALGVAIGLVCLVGILWLLRGRSGPSPFVRGGRNRNPRLQVLDAAAVDTRRRLVLVRRDDVEHLIMIGGPTDIVVESGIRSGAPARLQAEALAPQAPVATPELTRQAQARIAAPAAEAPPAARETAREPIREREPGREQVLQDMLARETAARTAQPRGPAPVVDAPTAEARAETVSPRRSPSPPPAAAPTRVEPTVIPIASTAAVAPPRPEPVPPIVATSPVAPESPAVPAVDEAANALEAARSRVLTERAEPPKILPVGTVPVPPGLQQAADKPKVLGSDFEQILEEEMANNLASRQPPVIAQPAPPVQPQPQPRELRAPITGATPEPSLQDEVARIFGELSVTRDK